MGQNSLLITMILEMKFSANGRFRGLEELTFHPSWSPMMNQNLNRLKSLKKYRKSLISQWEKLLRSFLEEVMISTGPGRYKQTVP